MVDCEQKCGNALGNFELFKILFNLKDFIEFFSTRLDKPKLFKYLCFLAIYEYISIGEYI